MISFFFCVTDSRDGVSVDRVSLRGVIKNGRIVRLQHTTTKKWLHRSGTMLHRARMSSLACDQPIIHSLTLLSHTDSVGRVFLPQLGSFPGSSSHPTTAPQ